MARSTWQLTISPGATWLRPLALAMSFWASVWAGGGDALITPQVSVGCDEERAQGSRSCGTMRASMLPTCDISIWYS